MIALIFMTETLEWLGLAKTVQIYKHSMYPKYGLTYKSPSSEQMCLLSNESADDLGDLVDLGTSHMFFNSKTVDLTTVNHFSCLSNLEIE